MLALNKVKTPGSPSDFRPISLLNFLSKAHKYIVHQQTNVHIETYHILDCMQIGFKKIIVYKQLSLNLQMISELGSIETMLLTSSSSILARPSTLFVTYPFSAN